ncbi:Bug family tripartite tricarboxylate transporter substrate binding protein [Ramlibacter alkalitolerans]|jgi:tripartite-type tricarboxylate transporter receptor subunit TctC|uniref:Tripartite tricarboxylate transporter substrate binding protein n=1 Tax=Ramlibacter alkalitolerans TaxID=2039631 RepID=A0ABS1JM12_9BURK|nr:tripartite tricarboxylate transporter substrate binding protein [Ramlibacter alkalitolerans]MBL0425284.1 tripartite tricarboxylate transporter substrate binding protein [Ramlibacter alkalitolerans]
MKRIPFLLATAALALGAIAPGATALAQDFPSRPIKFVVPFPPGSGTDTSARYFGRKLTEMTGQPVVVENKPGGNGFIAVQNVLAAPADGYTVFVGSNSTLAVNVALFKKLPYNPQADFAPLSMMMRAPTVIVVPPQSPYKTLADLIAAAKAQPGKLNHGGGSAGYQLMNEALNDRAGIDIRNVPFKGASEALTAVASGTVDVAFADITASTELIKSGKLRALAVASDRRASALPSVPHMGEAGLPGYGAYVWVGAMVPAKTPKAETAKLATLLAQIERLPETREFYEKIGAETMQGGADEMRRFQADEIALWKRIATKANVQQE